MQRSSRTTSETRRHSRALKAWLGVNGDSRPLSVEPPLRSDLFGVDQLRQHAVELAGAYEIGISHAADRLLPRLADNERVLLEAYQLVTSAVEAHRSLEPAGEWLLDNFYLIEEQIRTARRHLPKKYSRELPRLVHGSAAGYPRVYDIALELISHVDGKVDAEHLTSFVSAYQTAAALQLGELWAIPIMLRLALIENLRRVAARIASDRMDRDLADLWADRLTETAEKNPRDLVLTVADMARSDPQLSSPFVAELSRRLQGQSSALAVPLTWIEQRLSEKNMTIDQSVQQESQQQAADQVSIGNSIGSLRFLDSMDWREFVEQMSVVEQMLRSDPADVYPAMDFATRDRYRHVVERTARHSRLSEREVARAAIDLAREAAVQRGADDRASHVGFYLIDKGFPALQRAAKAYPSLRQSIRRLAGGVPLAVYLGAIAAIVVLVVAGATEVALAAGAPEWSVAALVALVGLGASQLGLALVNWAAPFFVRPRQLPRLDYSDEIPLESRTLVVIPTLLASPRNVQALVESLELHYLANRHEHLRFALLTDFRDAPQEIMPADESLLVLARRGIEELNKKHQGDGPDIFFLLHRPRRWNAQERAWMGHERKRGKLGDLNALLRGSPAAGRFSQIVGDVADLQNVKYVITLDTDTKLPRDSARELVATFAHPLNRARYDERAGRVVDGYTILQPRVATTLVSASRSRFVKIQGGDPGVDPYTRVVSDVYQDVFREGSFIGKGIYDVDAFERTLAGRFPDNLILSHDLLEGCYARSALVSDIELYEEYPSRYLTDASRRHRWIRGDWQIIGWLLPRVPAPAGVPARNPLSMLSRWKIFDNLRRSVVPAASAGLLLLGWFALPWPALWTLVVVGMLVLPVLCAALGELAGKPEELPLRLHVRPVFGSLLERVGQVALTLVFLPYEAYHSLDAILRTLTRLTITHRRLLEWRTASEAEHDDRGELLGTLRAMWIAPVAALAVGGYLLDQRVETLAVAGPILALWLVAPAIAWWISRPLRRGDAELDAAETLFLHKLACRTWRFFETFVGAEDNWLPPDNYQEYPVAVIAHRTSPTNIGLSLLANLAAYDFGYLSAGKLLARTAATVQSLEKMERFRGHFYNWYDTHTLAPLRPLYVSTVDSGNLAGCLLTLQAGLAELSDAHVVSPRQGSGLADTIDVFLDTARARTKHGRAERSDADSASLAGAQAMAVDLRAHDGTLRGHEKLLGQLVELTGQLVREFGTRPHEQLTVWVTTLDAFARESLEEWHWIAPWLELPAASPSTWESADLQRAARLNEVRTALAALDATPTLRQLAQLHVAMVPTLDRLLEEQSSDASAAPDSPARDWLGQLRAAIANASGRASERMERLAGLVLECGELCEIDYEFLYDRARNLLTIGYNVDQRRQDNSFYDLLASEARLSSFIGIAQGHLPQDHWFALGRLLTTTDSEPVLLSWSGSMFEYLMPQLIMPSYQYSLLDETCKAAVDRQIAYARERGVPWGMSESGYNVTDAHLNYQYRAFGVPGLGFKRGLADDLVVAPYATMLALTVAPQKACENLHRMQDAGYLGAFGFYEAIDFTPSRVPRGQPSALVRSFMTHHQGMGFLALAYRLLDRPMQRRFASNPAIRASDLLLQERIPKAAPFYPHASEVLGASRVAAERQSLIRVFVTPNTQVPEVHLLSNGRYHVVVTNAGGGYSRWRDTAVTRWTEDTTRDACGIFCYLRDLAGGNVWSTAHQPTLRDAETYEAIFLQGRAEFRRRDFGIETHAEIAVSPEDDIELRRVTITNRSRTQRKIEVTSYAEVVINHPAADAAHPSFSNLFVQSEIVASPAAILCTRRPRSSTDQMPWLFHLMATQAQTVGPTTYETDRSRFIGRGRTVANPHAMTPGATLTHSEGPVLDPIVAVRRTVVIEPDESAVVDIVTGMAETRDAALTLAQRYHDRHLADRVFELAWAHSQVMLQQLNMTEAESQLYGRLASPVLYAQPTCRAPASVLLRNRRGQSGLWGYGISGDSPIVLVRIGDPARIDLVRQMVQAHAYWRSKGLAVDLVIWNEDQSGYRQALQDQIMGLIAAGTEANAIDRPGGIFIRRTEQMADEDRALFQTIARVIVSDSGGTLADQVDRRTRPEPAMPRFAPLHARRDESPRQANLPAHDLTLFNGLGGFATDGREYVVITSAAQRTPAPWVNVLANPQFGSVVSESGNAYSWSENAHEFRLTPWYNDPITDAGGEAFYIRDDENGRYWSAAPQPAGGEANYVTRHGFGYSVFECAEQGIASQMWAYVDADAPVKFVVLRLRNDSGRPRRFSIYGYVEWVLGELRSKSLLHLTTEIDAKSGALLARNPYNSDFADRVAFFDASSSARTVTGDRAEFVGRNGTLASPAALGRTRLSGKVGAGFDPCGAMQVPLDLGEGQTREVVFVLGAGRNLDEARTLVQRYRGNGPARAALDAVMARWRRLLGAVTVKTPDPTLDLLANGWLIYQTIACRLWGRSGFYQSGGAFGFRDQLQDAMALVHTEPRLLREQLLRAAAHQFREGDAQHWWHPPLGRGVRTRFSDDFLWLPLAVCRYVASTRDTGVLDERIAFLEGRPCKPDEESYYDLPARSEDVGTLYDHCSRAIAHGLNFGQHGLPLMGCGDWNDGMNLVGAQGKGESVWLAFFLYDVLVSFGALARERGDGKFADRCTVEAEKLRQNIEAHAWDGQWYRRAYFDDGRPLGSAENSECQIDSLPQSWSALSGAGPNDRVAMAMAAVDKRLVRRGTALVQIFDPPFDKSDLEPGYIKGYLPGVRENGGQYTHAAVWVAMAAAARRDPGAWELFSLINPLRHGSTAREIATYKVEPYVVAGDVYAVAPHVGRGGWSWYTGSAGWMYRLIVESLLGLRIEGDKLRVAPLWPADWKSFEVEYRYRDTTYRISVSRAADGSRTTVALDDGPAEPQDAITLVDDRKPHKVNIAVG